MRPDKEVEKQIELQGAIFSRDAVSEALQIEEVLNRAHEIHRAHGGLFGYDLEDWLEAERELVERNRQDQLQVECQFGETARVGSLLRDAERNSEKCFGLDN